MNSAPPPIVGLGTPEQAWRDWPGLSALPAVSPGELAAGAARVVVVAPHPDDEVLAFGGLLAQLPDLPVLLVAVSDGTASSPGSTAWPPARLLQERPDETQEALRRLGVSADVVRLGLPDGEVDADDVRRGLSPLLRPDDVVLTTWRGDGHPDHEATGQAAAACGARLLEAPVWTWHWAVPADPRVPWERAVRVDLPREVLARKRDAVAAYRSQVDHDPALELGAVLPEAVLARLLRPFEVVLR